MPDNVKKPVRKAEPAPPEPVYNTIHDPFETTRLSPLEEVLFNSWAKKSKIKDLDNQKSKYDYRGFWKQNGPVRYEWGLDHLPDTWKQHGHETFSNESVYSKNASDGGMWDGETFIPEMKPVSSHGKK